jgi:putative hydrolase of the HAD superfamily
LNLGKTRYAQLRQPVGKVLGQAIPMSLLIGPLKGTPPNAQMFELARNLRIGCTTGIITDNTEERMDHLRRHQRLDALFDPIVASAEIGSTKDAPAIFKYALKPARVRPEESIFVDSSRANLVAPAALGMNAVYSDDAKNDVAGLVQHLREGYGVSITQSGA